MIDDSKNFFLDIMRKWDDDYQPERFYKFLDVAKDLVQTYLKVKDNDKCREPFHELVLDTFGQECQQAKSWIRQDIGHNPNVATEAKVTYLKDWTAYIDRIYSWISSAFKNGKADLLEYKRLENLRDGLWEQSNFFCQADTHYLETKADQLKEKITRLTTSDKADLPAKSKKKGMAKKIIGWIFKKASHFIFAVFVTIVGTVIAAIVVDIFADFGWIERIETIVRKILARQ